MHYSRSSLAVFQSGIELLIQRSLQQITVLNAIRHYGYDEPRLHQMQALNADLLKLAETVEQAKKDRQALFKEKRRMYAAIKRDYMRYLKLTRILLAEDKNAVKVLMLNGIRERKLKDFTFQMTTFVSNLLNSRDWLNALSVYNISPEDLRSLDARLKDLMRLDGQCNEAQNEVKRLLIQRKKKLLEMQRQVSDFVKVLRIALEQQSNLLAGLGLTTKNKD
ncbi:MULTISPECIES: hypothetical protein [unclassified Carboxylicivirga]|uniref:hypothetical protein n=1 Tax=Carboxylicivirga TaxID=1628153 RepID=UPI003D3275E6